MAALHSDALVFLGATGDLAYKKVFPALQAMIKRGRLDVPVIGVAKAGWKLDQLKARARDSVEKHGGLDASCFEKLSARLESIYLGDRRGVNKAQTPPNSFFKGPAEGESRWGGYLASGHCRRRAPFQTRPAPQARRAYS